ncbi:MAG: NHL repeat-containing protein [Acidimicrobiia bacterium]
MPHRTLPRTHHRRPRRAPFTVAVTVTVAVATAAAVLGMAIPAAAADPGTITTVAGSATPGKSTSYGYGGDGGPAAEAQLHQPRALGFDGAGNAYVADSLNQRIRKVDKEGTITTVAGNGTAGFAGDGGPATEASLNTPHGVAADAGGNLYISDSANHRIRKVDAEGIISTIAGNGTPGATGEEGPAAEALIKNPKSIIFDGKDSLYFADSGNNRICRISLADGKISTVAGTVRAGYEGDGGPANRAKLDTPNAMWVMGDGVLYIADSDNHRIRKVDPKGIISTVAGTGEAGSGGDGGPAAEAQLNDPRSVVADAAGNVYVGEELGHRVRRIDTGGTISTIAGTGTAGFSGDGGKATEAQFDGVRGLAFDGAGNLWVADVSNNRLRVVWGVAPPR